MKTKTEILSKLETDSLKKELLSIYLTFFIIFLMLIFLIHLFALAKYDKWIIPHYEILILLFVGAICYIMTIFITRPLRIEIQNGQKIVEYRTIEDKCDFIDKQDRFSSEYRKYVIIADKNKFIVTEEQYSNAQINDLLVVHITPLREERLKIEIEKNTSL
jgi:hypothetical protein